ncbi:benzoate-CoA ligase family protein [Amycolatopsis sp. SID8362]|uniref:benzoate-CoA ligase family protein n=1 Tax=Amycolatopsis sp. SID8362 TaxID=2690346 RepID=UPI00136941D6|nr:benzoate-CoA ligase family protein [Amycolatopsis sp. SID8362]NBH08705.1 benzoate-CoA ligase family protein [Amycolatopsis sp. SID8362]NED45399.1 benzoate-CoA ligase family protein [Amycolatopsis sp. SID8362]
MSEPFNLATHFLDRHVASGRVALLAGDRSISYGELAELANRAGNVLRDAGVRKGQRVLLALSDGPEFVATWYGAQKIGAVTAEVYPFLQPKDYAYYLGYTEAVAVVADAVTLPALRSAGARNLLVLGVPAAELRPDERPFRALLDAASPALAAAPTTLDDVGIWKFTTGSTGAPKACVHTLRSPLESFERYAVQVLGLREDDRILAVPKLFFGYARDLVALFPFGVGAAGIVFPERSTADLIFELIARHRPTVLVNVPTMMSAMVAHPAAAEQDLSCLRMTTSAGEALPSELHRKWDATFGVPVVDGIGSSEAYHIYLSNRPGQARTGTLGTAVPGYTAEVVDELGNPLPDGEIGPLRVTGPTIALEYFGDPEKSARTFDGDTLTTGDLFSRSDGYFRHHGRADALLKVGGVFVAPGEIEDCLLGHPSVVDCAVVGHEVDGLVVPRAYVVVRTPVPAEELKDHAKAHLAKHKYPREVVFVTELPRTANGKLDRRALAARP